MSEEEINDILEEIDETWGLAGKKAIVNLIDKHEKLIYENISLQEELDRLQKENEKLKEKEKNLLLQLKDSEKELIEVTQNIVSKDKIRNKIKEYYEKQADDDVLTALENLLKEN